MMLIPQFYQSEAQFKDIHHNLKFLNCPHCDKIGNLNLHGFLKGYDENSNQLGQIRGHRIYCSNRANRNGCGKTFSIILHSLLKKYIISTSTIWNFLQYILKGSNIFQAFQSLQSTFKISTAYRIIKSITLNQPNIRTRLLNIHAPPKPSENHSPIAETIRHLKSCFPYHKNPIASFQIHFQTPFI